MAKIFIQLDGNKVDKETLGSLLEGEHELEFGNEISSQGLRKKDYTGYDVAIFDQHFTYNGPLSEIADSNPPELCDIYGFKPVALHISVLHPDLNVALLAYEPRNYQVISDHVAILPRDEGAIFDYIVSKFQ